MNPKELRISNYLCDKLTGALLRVIELNENNVSVSVVDRSKFPLPEGWQAVPMKITYQLIGMLGFKAEVLFEDSRPIYTKDNFCIDYDTLQPIEAGFELAKYEIEYIHQLQNLYFALTGKELSFE